MEVTLDDVHLEVSQQDESGPRAAIGSVLEGKDALRLSMRQLLLTPQGVHLYSSDLHSWHPVSQELTFQVCQHILGLVITTYNIFSGVTDQCEAH